VKKLFAGIIVVILAVFSVFYLLFPLNVILPIFHGQTISYYSQEYNLDPLFVAAIIKAESKFANRARSHAGAIGLMQLMPATARELAAELGMKNISEKDLENPKININLGTYYLSKLNKIFNGDTVLILCAYNAGISNALSWKANSAGGSLKIEDIPYRETKKYINNVLRTYEWLKQTQKIKNLIRGKII